MTLQKLNIFDKFKSDKIEVRDDNNMQDTISPENQVNFFKGTNSVFDWQGQSHQTQLNASAIGLAATGRYQTSMGPAQALRPGSHRNMSLNLRKSNNSNNRSIKLKDEISLMRSSKESKQFNKTAVGFKTNLTNTNLGTIINYKKTEGINDQSMLKSFRKWTGMPQTTRNASGTHRQLMPGLNHKQAANKLVASHRKHATIHYRDSLGHEQMSQQLGQI